MRDRPEGRETRRRHRPAQPHAPAEAAAGAGGGSRAEEHPDDRSDRRWQDGDRAASRAARRSRRSSKVEASKFTEVGYVGRDVESMVRDLVELAIDMVREERLDRGPRQGRRRTPRSGLLDLLLPPTRPIAPTKMPPPRANTRTRPASGSAICCATDASTTASVEIDVREKSFPSFEIIAGSSVEEVDINLKDMLPGLFQGKTSEAPP